MSERQPSEAEVKEFVAERNAMLERGDLTELRAFMEKWNPEMPPLSSEVAEVTLHKSRTAALGLPEDMRRKSNRWLFDRGYESFDPSLGDHDWFGYAMVSPSGRTIECCRRCGIVRRADDANKPCRGFVTISLRDEARSAQPNQPTEGEG